MKQKIFNILYKTRYKLYDNGFYFLEGIIEFIVLSDYFHEEWVNNYHD